MADERQLDAGRDAAVVDGEGVGDVEAVIEAVIEAAPGVVANNSNGLAFSSQVRVMSPVPATVASRATLTRPDA